MKVKIGKYTTWFGPYQLAELLCFWAKKEKDEFGLEGKPDWVHNFGEYLAHGSIEKEEKVFRLNSNRNVTVLYKLLIWIESKKKRRVEIHIDKWDTWGMDHTLSMVILPMLIQLKATKQGSPNIEDEDVPKHLRSNVAPDPDDEYSDLNVHKRWDWIMDEMIWAFTQINDDNNESQFHTGNSDIYFEKVEGKNFSEMKHGPLDTYVFDKEGHTAHIARIQKGTTLFGKYFRGLWN